MPARKPRPARNRRKQSLANRLRRWATIAGIVNAVVLVGIKAAAWLLTGSLALLTSTLDGGVDVIASIVTFIAVRYARLPPDREHRFGYGKAESLSALFQSLLMVAGALAIGSEAILRLWHPEPIAEAGFGIVVIIVSGLTTLALVLFQAYVVKRTRSRAIAADAAHYRSDVAMNIAILLALALTAYTGWLRFDPLIALAIAGYMIWSALPVARRAIDVLLDRELSDKQRGRIKELVLAHPKVRGLHDLRSRHDGERVFMEFHIEIDRQISVAQGHAIADDLEILLGKAFPKAEITIHQEPAGIDDERLDDRIREASEQPQEGLLP